MEAYLSVTALIVGLGACVPALDLDLWVRDRARRQSAGCVTRRRSCPPEERVYEDVLRLYWRWRRRG